VEPTLRAGARGPEVAAVQAVLIGLGHMAGTPSGHLDGSSTAALQAYQRRFGLTPDGVVGPATWARVREHQAMLREGAQLADSAAPTARPTSRGASEADVAPAGMVPPPREEYRLDVEPLASPSVEASPGAEAYEALLAYDQVANPLSLEETLSLARQAAAHQRESLAQTLAVPVDGGTRTIEVGLSAGIDPAEAQAMVQAMYAASHPEHRLAVQRVNLFSGPCALDEYYELRNASDKDFVSAATGGGGVITFYNVGATNRPQRQSTWDHELAHVYMERSPHTSSEAMVPAGWHEAIAIDRADQRHEFVTDYAATNAKEDFAESYKVYLEHLRDGTLAEFRRLYPARAAALDRLFQ
jgi:peptidoglycan hydrolase-like protein with peptidoglycan-binding domain